MINRDKALGAYIGAAVGDAMGGPVEAQHAARIKRIYGGINGFLPYSKPPGLIDLHPGYALHGEPGSITDDTYIRADMTRYFLHTRRPHTPAQLADYMLENADFSVWWPPAVEALKRIERGVVSPESGETHVQGGGIGWWTPVGILHAGDPEAAAAEAGNLCRIWKAPLERQILSGVQAGLAEAMRDGATHESVISAVLDQCGPEAAEPLQRGLDAGRNATSQDDLRRRTYRTCLLEVITARQDEPWPRIAKPIEDTDDRYISCLFFEQMALALAAFVFTRGDPVAAVPACVMLGRDCDSTSTTVGSWVGALHGIAAFPADWVEAVVEVNRVDFDLRALTEELIDLGS